MAVASAKQPSLVRDALLKAIRRVPLRRIDLTLLRIEHELQTALDLPWGEPSKLRLVLESCRQENVLNRTERLFFKHGGAFAIVVLGVATRRDVGRRTKYDGRGLLRDIDLLADEEIIQLAKNIQEFPKTAAIVAFLENFARSPSGAVGPQSLVSPLIDVTRRPRPSCTVC